MSTTHDPFAGYDRQARGAAAADDEPFPEDALRAAGASDEAVAYLRAHLATGEQRKAVRQGPRELAESLVRDYGRAFYDPTHRTVEQARADVSADPQLAVRALEVERAGKNRSILIAHLEDVVTGLEQALNGNVPDGEATAAAAQRQDSEDGTAGPYRTFDTAEQEVQARQDNAAEQEHPQEVVDAAEAHRTGGEAVTGGRGE